MYSVLTQARYDDFSSLNLAFGWLIVQFLITAAVRLFRKLGSCGTTRLYLGISFSVCEDLHLWHFDYDSHLPFPRQLFMAKDFRESPVFQCSEILQLESVFTSCFPILHCVLLLMLFSWALFIHLLLYHRRCCPSLFYLQLS